MRVSEVMTRGVECTRPDATLQEAAAKMKSLDIGPLPVCDNDRLVGMVTDRDITLRATASGRAPQSTAVAEVMTTASSWCNENDSVDDVLKKMGDEQIRRMPVIDAHKHVVGIVSLGDLATRQPTSTDRALGDVSQPSMPTRR